MIKNIPAINLNKKKRPISQYNSMLLQLKKTDYLLYGHENNLISLTF